MWEKCLKWKLSWKIGPPFGTLARKDKTIARRMTRWHVKMRSWHAFGTFARQARWHASTLAHKPRWHVDYVGTQPRMTCDLANSEKPIMINLVYWLNKIILNVIKLVNSISKENNVAFDKLFHWKIRLDFLRMTNSGALGFADNPETEDTWLLGWSPLLMLENGRKIACIIDSFS